MTSTSFFVIWINAGFPLWDCVITTFSTSSIYALHFLHKETNFHCYTFWFMTRWFILHQLCAYCNLPATNNLVRVVQRHKNDVKSIKKWFPKNINQIVVFYCTRHMIMFNKNKMSRVNPWNILFGCLENIILCKNIIYCF